MGLATIDPIVRKSTPRFTRFPSLVLIKLVLTEIQRFKNVKINKEMYGIHSVRMAIHFFVNFDIFKWLYLAYFWVCLRQTWESCESRCALSPTYPIEQNRTKNHSNPIELQSFDWVRQSNKIEHLFCCEFDFRTNRLLTPQTE